MSKDEKIQAMTEKITDAKNLLDVVAERLSTSGHIGNTTMQGLYRIVEMAQLDLCSAIDTAGGEGETE